MRIILTCDLDDDLLRREVDPDLTSAAVVTDLQQTFLARLSEVYPGPEGYAIPTRVRVGVGSEAAVQHLLDAARVGLDGGPEDMPGDEAFALLTVLDSE